MCLPLNVIPFCVTILLTPADFKAKRLSYLNARTVKECNATFLVKHRILAQKKEKRNNFNIF